MILFDSHAHYDDRRFDRDRDEVLSSLKGAGVRYVANIGSDLPSSRRSVKLAEQHDFIYAAVGVHPHNADDMVPQDFDELEGLLKHPKVRALGEIGLDYYRNLSPKMVQLERFAQQMELAEKLKVPVVIHEREAAGDCLDIVKQYNIEKGVFHCYSGSVETAKTLVALGYYLSFTGVVTFGNARRACEVIRWMPRDRLMIETDCPYLTPEPFRGKRNDSTKLIYTLNAVAELLGVTAGEAAEITTRNAMEFYGIKG